MLSRLPRNAPAWLDRLSAWLEPFEVCFTHVAQRGAFRRYLLGLLSDSRRKSMSAMLERVTIPARISRFSTSSRTRRGVPNECGGSSAWSFPSAAGY